MNFILFKSNLFTSNCFKIFPSLFDVHLIFTCKNRVHSSKIVTFSFEIYSKHFSVNFSTITITESPKPLNL